MSQLVPNSSFYPVMTDDSIYSSFSMYSSQVAGQDPWQLTKEEKAMVSKIYHLHSTIIIYVIFTSFCT